MQRLFSWLRRCLLPLLMLTSFLPLMLLWLCTAAPDSFGEVAMLFAAYVLASAVCVRLPGAFRLLGMLLGGGALMVLGCVLLPVRAHPLLLLLPGALTVLLLACVPFAVRPSLSEMPGAFPFIGIGVHFLAQFLYGYFSADGTSVYVPIAPALTASLIGYVLLFLLTMNCISLDNATFLRHRLPPGMRMVNTLLTVGFLAVSLIVALLPAVARTLTALWQGLTVTVARFFAFLLSLLPIPEDMGAEVQTAAEEQLIAEESIEHSGAVAAFIEKLAAIFTILLLAAALLFILHLLWQQLRRFFRYLKRRLREYAQSAGAEYDDEITDTREEDIQRQTLRARLRMHRNLPHDATPAARIRFTYAQMLRRHPEWAKSATARETLYDDAAALYERARYSAHPVTEEDARRFAREAKPSAPRTRGE